jgi:thymidylate synthase (FAD)
MVNVCLEIETTRDIARQLLRHRSFTFQEFSQRYANPDQAFDDMFEKREARMQDEKNRQNSVEVDDLKIETEWFRIQSRVEWMCKKQYQAAIKLGIAKEQARALLPEGLTKSRLYVSGSLRSWIHYIDIRSGNGTQKEHMELAKACGEIIYELFPVDLNESSN